ncbi:MAG: hypothetical protein MAG431_00068 [Chloroflexi bacterium]|nr:hypothetical protein [Chloroflexota bacterium]
MLVGIISANVVYVNSEKRGKLGPENSYLIFLESLCTMDNRIPKYSLQ